MLFQLREEGVEAGMLSWALAKELEQLLTLRLAQECGRPLGPLMEQARIWQSRQALVQQALNRLSSRKIIQLLELAARLDASLRAFEQDQTWLWLVITSYSIHYTKLYDGSRPGPDAPWLPGPDAGGHSGWGRRYRPAGRWRASCGEKLQGVGIAKTQAQALQPHRITSYNVCYTKLLRPHGGR